MLEGIELVELDRKDECCGFGGTFCVMEEAVSVKMGKDSVQDLLKHKAQFSMYYIHLPIMGKEFAFSDKIFIQNR